MGREVVRNLFRELSSRDEKALAVYITAGYPSMDECYRAIISAVEAGADIIEIGIPFSDPIADGPVIQETTMHALQQGVNMKSVFELVRRVKTYIEVPVFLMGYWNPFLQLGEKKLFSLSYRSGVDGFIIPDLPPEEGAAFYRRANEAGFATVLFVSPVTPPGRIALVERFTTGFVYFISVTGITGARLSSPHAVSKFARQVKKKLSHPLLIGFGISTPEEARKISSGGDGIIVGTAFLKALKEGGVKKAASLVSNLKQAILGK